MNLAPALSFARRGRKEKPMQIIWSLFPKIYPHLNPAELAALVREVGLDTTNVVIREGYRVQPASLRSDLPIFVATMRDEGITIHFATTGFRADEIAANPDLLTILADNGLTAFRMDHFRLNGPDIRGAMALARRQLEAMVPICERAGIRAVYQTHHDTLIPSASAAWSLVEGLPARAIGVELDPGNQSFEGYESWRRSAGLLREYLVAAAVKDTKLLQKMERAGDADKGWRREWCPIDEGVTDWQAFIAALAQNDFNGTFVFMPFYNADNPAQATPILKREVAYLRQIVRAAQTHFLNSDYTDF